MSILDILKDTLKGIPISDIQQERISLLLQTLEVSEAKADGLRTENAKLQAMLEIERENNVKVQHELHRLKEEHTEEVCIYRTVEMRKGKRTGGVWQAFCPKCHMPLSNSERDENGDTVYCTGYCGWRTPNLKINIGSLAADFKPTQKAPS